MATFRTSAIVEIIDKTRTGARSIEGNFAKIEKAADAFGDEADKAANKGLRSFEEYSFEVRKASRRLDELKRDLRSGKGDFRAIQKEIDDTTQSLRRLNREERAFAIGRNIGGGIRRGAGTFGRGALIGGGLLATGAAATFGAANFFAGQADDALKLAQNSGFAVESVTALRFALSQTVSDEAVKALPAILRDLNARIGEFKRTGGGELSSLDNELKTILVSAENTEDAFVRIGDEIRSRNLDTATLASTLEKLFGEPGRQLVPFFQKSQDQIDELIFKARQFGVVISEETAKDAQRFRDELGESRAILQGIGTTFFGKLFGEGADILDTRVNPALNRFQDFVENINAEDIENAFENVADSLGGALEAVEGIAQIVDQFVTTDRERRAELERLSTSELVDVTGSQGNLLGAASDQEVRIARELLAERFQASNNLAEARNINGLLSQELGGLGTANADTSEITRLLGELVGLVREDGSLLTAGTLADGGIARSPTTSTEPYSGNSISYGPPVGIDFGALSRGLF